MLDPESLRSTVESYNHWADSADSENKTNNECKLVTEEDREVDSYL